MEKAARRQRTILELLARQPEIQVEELAKRFGVAAMTVRRDLDALEEKRRLTRTHGGATASARSIVAFSFEKRRQTRLAEKRAIAQAALGLLRPDATVILDTGTTTLEIAARLGRVPGLKILTTSLAIASSLLAHEGIELILLGGTINRRSPDLSGALTQENLRSFRADLAFIGADKAGPDGLFTESQEIAAVSKTMIASAARVVLVADSGKFGQAALVRFATWEQIETLIVDDGLANEHRRWVSEQVRHVIYAPVDTGHKTGHRRAEKKESGHAHG